VIFNLHKFFLELDTFYHELINEIAHLHQLEVILIFQMYSLNISIYIILFQEFFYSPIKGQAPVHQ